MEADAKGRRVLGWTSTAALIAIALVISSPAAAEVCDKGEEVRLFSTLLYWMAVVFLGLGAIVRRSRTAAWIIGVILVAPMLLTLIEGDTGRDPFVRAMIAEGCKLDYGASLKQDMALAALAPLAIALPFLTDRLWPRRGAHP